MTKQNWDCILIPGGGLQADGSIPPWTKARLEKALSLANNTRYFGLLSGGTVHKPPPLDRTGFPIFESQQAANFLFASGVDPEIMLTEICSFDTIGNAYFSRMLFAEPFSFQHLLIITSNFHLDRTKAIFQWVYTLPPTGVDFQLGFYGTPDVGLSNSILHARKEREKSSLNKLQNKIQSITSLNKFQHWLYSEHAAYSVVPAREELSPNELSSY